MQDTCQRLPFWAGEAGGYRESCSSHLVNEDSCIKTRSDTWQGSPEPRTGGLDGDGEDDKFWLPLDKTSTAELGWVIPTALVLSERLAGNLLPLSMPPGLSVCEIPLAKFPTVI